MEVTAVTAGAPHAKTHFSRAKPNQQNRPQRTNQRMNNAKTNFALDHETRRQLGYQLIDRINAYFDSLPDRAVQLPAGKRSFDQLCDSMPELSADASRV